MSDIFLSYAAEDRDRIAPLVERLSAQGWTVWWDRNLVAGPDFARRIEAALHAARCVVVAWSRHSVDSDWCRAEADQGLKRGILVPLALDPVTPPLPFGTAHTAALNGWPKNNGELDSLLAGIRTCLDVPPPQDVAPVAQPAGWGWRSLLATLFALVVVTAGGAWLALVDTPDQRAQTAESSAAGDVGVPADARRVAVMPLRDLSAGQDLDWLAEGIAEELRNQIGAWPGFQVLPGALVRGRSLDEIGAEADIAVDGFIRGEASALTVQLDVISLRDRSKLLTTGASGTDTDPYELQRQLGTGLARHFGEGLGASNLGGPDPQAWPAYMRYLQYAWMGDADQHLLWVRRTLAADPDWSDGWGDLGLLLFRQSSFRRDSQLRQEALEVWNNRNDGAVGFQTRAPYVDTLFRERYEEAAAAAALLAREWGYVDPLLWLMLSYGLSAEANAAAEAWALQGPFNHLVWQELAMSRAHLGDARGSMRAVRHLMRLYPGPGTASVFMSWALPNSGDLDAARDFIAELRAMIDGAGPQQAGVLVTALLLMQLELALLENDRPTAESAAAQLSAQQQHLLAAIAWLRLGDEQRAAAHAADIDPHYDRWLWIFAAPHIVNALPDHPLKAEIERQLGFTTAWRRRLCEIVAELPPETQIRCDPTNYPIEASAPGG